MKQEKTLKARNDFWSMEGDFIHRHHVPQEETFPNPQKHFDVTSTTHTNLDVLQERCISDEWDDDVDQSVSDSWTGFTKFTVLNANHLKGHMCSGQRPTKKSSNCQT